MTVLSPDSADRYAVFGNPVNHSRSPEIHRQFAGQFAEMIEYRRQAVEPERFDSAVKAFFAAGGRGLNITVPFKVDAWRFADELSERAQCAQSVNTLKRLPDGRDFGDTTDGVGLVRDMTANLGWQLAGKSILVIGAGGAVAGVLEALLGEGPRRVLIVNRTAKKAVGLAEKFLARGPVAGGGFDALGGDSFDLLINGTSTGLSGERLDLPDTVLCEESRCYDMVYGTKPTAFMRWAAEQAVWATSDGLGMLVEQAAESYYLWRGKRPDTRPVIRSLRHR